MPLALIHHQNDGPPAVYNASVYGAKRYRDWQDLGGSRNPDTEEALRKVRWAGDSLILGWSWRDEAGNA